LREELRQAIGLDIRPTNFHVKQIEFAGGKVLLRKRFGPPGKPDGLPLSRGGF